MADTSATLPLTVGYTSDGAYSLKEYHLVHLLAQDTALRYTTAATINTEDEIASLVDSDEWELVWWGQGEGDSNTLWQRKDQVLVVNSYDSNESVYVKVFGKTLLDVQTTLREFRDRATPVEIKRSDTVSVKFWSVGNSGAQALARDIAVEDWCDVEENYSTIAHDDIGSLLTMTPPFEGGRIVLWHGPPGTGKSHALRALIKAWEPWCDANYIVDPDVVFSRAAVLMDLLIGQKSYGLVNAASFPDAPFVLDGNDRWRLFIMEDTDEFLKSDAKEQRGQAMSRLLNTADGFIGQGLKILWLITTNEPMNSIHEAVSRPGRCVANTEVAKFTPDEAKRWLAKRDVHNVVFPKDTVSLADCYDQLRQHKQIARVAEPVTQIGQYL